MGDLYKTSLTLGIFTEPDSSVSEVAAVELLVGNSPEAEDAELYLLHCGSVGGGWCSLFRFRQCQ